MDAHTPSMALDLAASGLVVGDMYTCELDGAMRAAANVPHSVQGFMIPYFSIRGKPEPFYRVKLFDYKPKYKQPKDTDSYVYFPPSFMAAALRSPYIIITEGEKKAALATKLGFPTCALGGVDAWRNRTVSLPADTELNQLKNGIKAKLPAHTGVEEDTSGLAKGLQELIDFVLAHKKTIIICYDSDTEIGIQPSVQRAAAALAFDLRFRGLPFNKIRQIVLPVPPKTTTSKQVEKLALDDYLLAHKAEAFQDLVTKCLEKKSAFPRHPNIQHFISQKLQRSNLARKELQQIAMGILSDLDANGIRLRNKDTDESYYFDFVDRKLIKTIFSERQDDLSGTSFGQFLYRRYGLASADKRLTIWLGAQFTGEDPIEEVSPFRVIARLRTRDDAVYYQVSDSQYVGVTADGIELYDNGENGILFESGQVLPLDTERLFKLVEKESASGPKLTNYWSDTLSSVRLRDKNAQKDVASLLYYMSPYLYRWRGMQLPVEMVLGESGSGKSTLCELRLSIITGEAKLRNTPSELKDWHASIINTGGLHVTDNVQLVDRSLRQRLSDEICRIVTEPNPTVESRRLYSNAELASYPVSAVFAITAIQQPFQNADILQRSIILELDKSTSLGGDRKEVVYDSEWLRRQLDKFGNREGWIAHELVVLQRFFQLVQKEWKSEYYAKHRLINFEQSMMLMAKVFGMDAEWIPGYLNGVIESTLRESDWTFEGLGIFTDEMMHHYPNGVTATDISSWAEGHEDYSKCEMLTNARRLGRYMQTHKSTIQTALGLREAGKKGNKVQYKLVEDRKPKNK